MSTPAETAVGSVTEIHRYPVKSMLGEALSAADFGPRGMIGDRAYAVIDPETGKVASAKNPKKWPNLFECRAAYLTEPSAEVVAPVRITLPDGAIASTVEADLDAAISTVVGRAGELRSAVPKVPILEEYWPDMEELDHRDEVTDEAMPDGTFFDCASVHLVTTGTLNALRAAYPSGRFEIGRFRPNIVIGTPAEAGEFPESSWVGRTLAVGDVLLRITQECGRCVMVTLPQPDLPRDPGILRTAAQRNSAHVGIYAEVIRGGTTRQDDTVLLLD